MKARAYVEDRVFARQPDIRVAALFVAEPARYACLVLHALRAELLECVEQVNDEGVAHTRLAWWGQELAASVEGQPAHPVAQALQPLIRDHQLPAEYLMEMLDGATMDLRPDGYESLNELLLRCHRLDSMTQILCVHVCGYEDHNSIKFAHNLGVATALVRLITRAGADYQRNRLRLPHDLLARHGATPADLGGSTTPPRMRAVLHELGDTASEHFNLALALLPAVDRHRQRGAMIQLRLAHRLLAQLRRDDFEVLAREQQLRPLTRLWVAWRAARKEEKTARSDSANSA